MIFNRHHWGPQTVYQAEKPGAPESKAKKRGNKQVRMGALKGGEREKKLANKGLLGR